MGIRLASVVATGARRLLMVVLLVVEVVIRLSVRASPGVGIGSEDTQSKNLDERHRRVAAIEPKSSGRVEKLLPIPVVRSTESESKRSARPFQHHALTGPRTIRLVQLLPGGLNDPLRCKILHISLDENPQYEAVSYVWGQRTTTSTSPVLIVEPGHGHIRVTDNCNRVLRILRNYIRKRTLWIDAICINQDSDATDERNHQVGLMGEIYKQAACVLIYPRGPKDDLHCDFTGLEESLKVRPDNWEALHVLRMEWFRRTWVLQEAYLARKAIIVLDTGPQRINISFDKFISESRKGLHRLSLKDSYWPAILDIRRELMDQAMSKKRSLRSNLLDLLIATRDLDATDPRDKIFALLGIASDGHHPEYTIDYSQTTAQVYVAYALTMLRQRSDLKFLSACNGSPLLDHCEDRDYWETKRLLPTWVPDWRRRVYNNTIWDHSCSTVRGGYIGRARAQPADMIHDLRLRVRGYIIGTVYGVGPVLRGSPIVSQVAKFFYNESTTIPLPPLRRSNPFYDRFPWLILSERAQHTEWLKGLERVQNAEWLKGLDSLLHGRKVFMTDDGYYGLAPYQTSDGDLLCQLGGCRTPVLLRRVPDFVPNPGNWYMLVGECYVHGIMDGEEVGLDEMDDYEII